MEQNQTKRTIAAWEILLIVLGSPVWLPILIAVFAILLSLYISLWSAIISLWAVFGSFVISAVGAALAGVVLTIVGKALSGVFLIGAGLIFAGLSVFMFFIGKLATKGILFLTKKIALAVISRFRKKETI